jgi:hypothetical protein
MRGKIFEAKSVLLNDRLSLQPNNLSEQRLQLFFDGDWLSA